MKKAWVGSLLCLMCACSHVWAEDALFPVVVRFHWLANVEFAGILEAKERGWYAEAGLDVTPKGWENGVSGLDEVATGKAHIGVQEGATMLQARAKGTPVKAFATQFQRSPVCLASKEALGLTTPESLKGKRIGYQSDGGLLMIDLMLKHQGMSSKDVTLVQIGWDLKPLLNDEVDAFVAYMTNQPLMLKEQGQATNVIPAYDYGYDFYSSVYFAHEQFLKEHPEIAQKFLDATLRGWREAFAHPEETAKMIVEKYYPDGSVAQQTEELKIYHQLATMGVGEDAIGMMSEELWQKGIDVLLAQQQIAEKIPAQDVFTTEFLEKTSANTK